MGARMTVVRLSSGSLVLISPVRPNPELRTAVDGLGEVRSLVCPNRWHHLFAPAWKESHPGASLYAVEGIEKRAPGLKVDATLALQAPPEWNGELDMIPIDGFPMFDERAFLHGASRTLILTDMLANIRHASGFTRLYLWLNRALGRPGHTLMHRIALKDRAAARRSIDRLLDWDFERIVVAHGEVIESGGPAVLREAFTWV
ncbi:MAG: DUF4336 domain-containing protein [Pseudomonadales bacterium]